MQPNEGRGRMPIDRPRPNETREMRLISRVIKLTRGVTDTSLPEFIARRRTPGDGWRTWDELSFDLAEVIGEIVNDAALRRWAKGYGIPETSKRIGTDDEAAAYRADLESAGIVVA